MGKHKKINKLSELAIEQSLPDQSWKKLVCKNTQNNAFIEGKNQI